MRIDTKINEDHSTLRKIGMVVRPSKQIPGQKVKIKDYLELPNPDDFETFRLTRTSAIFVGKYSSPTEIEPEYAKYTPDTDKMSRNRIAFRSTDLILLEVMDYEESILDIVTRAEGEKELDKLVQFVLDVVIHFASDTYGKDYDLSQLEAYWRQTLPQAARRLYADLWEVRRARRGGILFTREEVEWQQKLIALAAQLGLPLPKPGAEMRLKKKTGIAFLTKKLDALTKPKREGLPPLSEKLFATKESRKKVADDFEAYLKTRFGSLHAVLAKIEILRPKIFGAYLGNQFSLSPDNPQLAFQVRLLMPGHIVQTNGLRDVNGQLLWTFTGEEVGLSGFQMWARSLVVRKKMVAALGLVNFPGSIQQVERFYRILRPHGRKVAPLISQAFSDSVKAHSLAPLEKLAGVEKNTAKKKKSLQPATAKADQETVAIAGRILVLLRQYLPRPKPPKKPMARTKKQEGTPEEEVVPLHASSDKPQKTVTQQKTDNSQDVPSPDLTPKRQGN